MNLTNEPEITLEEEIAHVKRMRVKGDIIIQDIKALPPTAERTLAMRKFQEGVMWLGMDLKRMGTPNPYPNSRDATNAIIDPTADGLKL